MIRHITLFLLLVAVKACSPEKSKPNLLFIWTDEQQYFTMKAYGNEVIQTPNLDRLAKEGMRFTQFYNNAKCTTTRASLLTGLYPRKGAIQIGSDADILIIDPGRETRVTARRLHMNSDYSPYDGMDLRGFPEITMLRGKVIQRDGEFLGKKGDGKFLKRD